MDQSSSGGQSDRQGGNRSRGNRNRRQRQNPGGKGSRQNQSSSNSGGGQGRRPAKKQGQYQQDQNRARGTHQRGSGNRRRPTPEVSWGQKLLSILTFGLLGKSDASRPPRNQKEKPKRPQTDAPQTPVAPRTAPSGERPSRKTVIREVTSPRLFVGNLDYEANESDLEDLFKGAGHVVIVEIATNPRTQQSKGFGFVEMSHIDEARRAVTILHDQEFHGRKLIVSGAKSEGSRTPGDDEEDSKPEQATESAAPEPEADRGEEDSAAA